jgi:hypothetical protein
MTKFVVHESVSFQIDATTIVRANTGSVLSSASLQTLFTTLYKTGDL